MLSDRMLDHGRSWDGTRNRQVRASPSSQSKSKDGLRTVKGYLTVGHWPIVPAKEASSSAEAVRLGSPDPDPYPVPHSPSHSTSRPIPTACTSARLHIRGYGPC